MTAQQFNLRWNNHTNNLIQVFVDQFEREQLVDVTLSCQGKFIKAHKLVLGACSPYFQEIFDRHGTTPHPVIIMNGLKFEDIKSIVEFMYKGEVKVCESDLEGLLATAESLQIKGLSNVRATRQGQGQSSPSPSVNSTGSGNNSSNVSQESGHSNQTRKSGGNPPSGNSGNASTSHNNSNSCSTGRHNSSHELHISDKSHGDHAEGVSGTPLHLRRKRAKTTSPNKDVNESRNDNSGMETHCLKTENAPTKSVLAGFTSSVDDESSDELPMTIKIEPPFIRDIDEEDDDEWDTVKDNTKVNETCDGSQDGKAGLMEPKEKIPRPPNAFMIFANEWRRKLATQFPNESNKEISVRLGIMWKNLSGDSKEEYFAASRQANEDHKKKYPDYYYSPKEARMRKRWKMQQQQVSHLMSSGQYNPVHLVKVFINEDGDGERTKQSSGSAASLHHTASSH
ncbi:unnamed protein product [Allacma fusca]|uniref:Uncharacterized protein n=1 Tax=Allacma fusca TaxID=39272 RepID=A0A8J2KPL8_9HEXA|nr:unnamed protein product [Allacma fusca]